MARITVSQAAKAGYASRPTIYRRIKKGDLTVHAVGDAKLVDIADLVRLFGEPGEKKGDPEIATDDAAIRNAKEVASQLEAERDAIAAQKTRLETELRDMRQELKEERSARDKERDRLMALAEDATATSKLLLEDQRENAEKGGEVPGRWALIRRGLFGG
jgi:hypothetical protein